MWPTPQDYNEAIQNPALCFEEAHLRESLPEINHLGLPRPMSGSFASVYHMHGPGGDWAVRCFLHNFHDQELRYQGISRFLASSNVPYTVDFQFVPRGICVHGQWYPILKMDWVTGEDMITWIERHLDEPAALANLRDRFFEMCSNLAALGIAHGDLQHGNILVVNDRLKLVDYDGMYVPELAHLSSNEIGHRHYQHPHRQQQHFGAYLDSFAAWSIYTSLDCLAFDPGLWYRLGGGDECLLFKHEDYLHTEQSVAFRLLEHHDQPAVRTAARRLRRLLALEVERMPLLGQPVDETAPLPELEPLPSLPAWMLADSDGMPAAVAEGPAPAYLVRGQQSARQEAAAATETETSVVFSIGGEAGTAAGGAAVTTGGAQAAGTQPSVPSPIDAIIEAQAAAARAAQAQPANIPPQPIFTPPEVKSGKSMKAPIPNMRILVQPPVPEPKPMLVVAPPPLQGARAGTAAGGRPSAPSLPAQHVPVIIQHATSQAPLPSPPLEPGTVNGALPRKLAFGVLPSEYVLPVLLLVSPLLLVVAALAFEISGTLYLSHTFRHSSDYYASLHNPYNNVMAEGNRNYKAGMLLFHNKKYSEAIGKFQAALAQYQPVPTAHRKIGRSMWMIGRCFEELKQNDVALTWYLQAHKNFQNAGVSDLMVIDKIAWLMLDKGDAITAANWFKEELDDASASRGNNSGNIESALSGIRAAAVAMLQKGDEQGIDTYSIAISPYYGDQSAHAAEYSRELHQLATDLQRKKKYELAYKVLYLAWELSNTYPDDAHTLQIEALQALQKNSEARHQFGDARHFAAMVRELEQQNLERSSRKIAAGAHRRRSSSPVVPNPRKPASPMSTLPDGSCKA